MMNFTQNKRKIWKKQILESQINSPTKLCYNQILYLIWFNFSGNPIKNRKLKEPKIEAIIQVYRYQSIFEENDRLKMTLKKCGCGEVHHLKGHYNRPIEHYLLVLIVAGALENYVGYVCWISADQCQYNGDSRIHWTR